MERKQCCDRVSCRGLVAFEFIMESASVFGRRFSLPLHFATPPLSLALLLHSLVFLEFLLVAWSPSLLCIRVHHKSQAKAITFFFYLHLETRWLLVLVGLPFLTELQDNYNSSVVPSLLLWLERRPFPQHCRPHPSLRKLNLCHGHRRASRQRIRSSRF